VSPLTHSNAKHVAIFYAKVVKQIGLKKRKNVHIVGKM
jgi:hypothetical protein